MKLKRLLLICLLGCLPLTVSAVPLRVSVEIHDSVPVCSIDDVSTRVSLVDMEEPPVEFSFNSVSMCRLQNNLLCFVDGDTNRNLYIYHLDGKLKQVFHHAGLGVQDYVAINDFEVDCEHNRILILDDVGIRYYSMDGQYLKTLELSGFTGGFVSMDDYLVLDAFNENSRSISIIDQWGKTLKSLIEVPSELRCLNMVSHVPSLQKVDDEVLYMPCMQPVLYRIDKDGAEMRYQLDFGDNWPDDSSLTTVSSFARPYFPERLSRQGKVVFLSFLEGRDILFLGFECGNSYYCYFLNQQTGEIVLYSPTEGRNGIPLAVHDNTFYWFFYNSQKSHVLVKANLKWKDYPSAVEGASSVSHNGREWLLLLPIVLLVGSFFLYRINKPGTPDSVSVEAFLPNGFLSEIQAKVSEIYNQRYSVNDRINSLVKLLHLETRKDFLRFFESNMPTSFAQAEDKELTEMDKTLLYLLMVKEFETQDLAYLLKIKTRTVYTGKLRLCGHLNLGSARELNAYLNARLKKARELQ